MSATSHFPPPRLRRTSFLPPMPPQAELPSFAALVRGAPFEDGSTFAHASRLAVILAERYANNAPGYAGLRHNLAAVEAMPSADNLLRAADAFQCLAVRDPFFETSLTEAARQLEYLAAVGGSAEAASLVASGAIRLAEDPATPDDEAMNLACAALGWLFVAGPDSQDEEIAVPVRDRAAAAAERVFDRMSSAWRDRLNEADGYDPDIRPTPRHPTRIRQVGRRIPHVGCPAGSLPDWSGGTPPTTDENDDDNRIDARPASSGPVVLRMVGGAATPETARVRQVLDSIVSRAMPLVAVPDLAAVRSSLVAAYPHAVAVIDTVLGQLVGWDHVRLAPIVLVGPPGCGKTSFAQDLLEALGVPHSLYACAAASDTSLAGNPRRWQTGEPSLPLSLIIERGVASPGIILDELEKAATGMQNGRLHDALLGLLEPRSSSAWVDPYAQAPVDLSRVIWIATANTVDGIPAALRDRCRILAFPAPRTEHLSVLAASILRRSATARGLDPRWAEPLDGMELGLVGRAWRGGSLRVLALLLEGVVAARDMMPGRN